MLVGLLVLRKGLLKVRKFYVLPGVCCTLRTRAGSAVLCFR